MARTDAKILLADDMKTLLMVEDGMFRNLGFKPVLAESGSEALRILKEGGIELAFLDYYMPDLNGSDVIRLFDGCEHEHRPAFIAITSDTPGVREQCLKEGFDEMLDKPVEPGRLLSILKRFIPGDR